MYGVVVCPRCKKAKGVDLKQKTTACACGFEIHVAPARVRARTANVRELPGLVGHVSAELAGGLEAYEQDAAPKRRVRIRDVHARVAAAVPKQGERGVRIRAAALGLTRELQVFTAEDWSRVLEDLGIPKAEAALESLVKATVVYEPKPGFYRSVDLSP